MPQSTRYKFLGCEILYREACCLAAAGRNRVDVQFLRKGLHDLKTPDMQAAIQQAVDQVRADDGYSAVLLGYARCNDGLVGVTARDLPLVLPRAHDCITLFFGSRYAYMDYFSSCPGTYYMTTGWAERDGDIGGPNQLSLGGAGVMESLGLHESYEQMVVKYGRENADFILESLGDWRRNYRRMLYLEMGACDELPLVNEARRRAAANGWEFQLRKGNWTLLRKLFDGQWDDDFIIVPPGRRIVACNDDRVVDVE